MKGRLFISCISVLCSILFFQGCNNLKSSSIKFQSEYQVVFLDNGQAFFGKLEGAGSSYPVLKDVYYVQSQTNPETKQVNSILIKRGKEWHSPDIMYLNAKHIVLIEPVSSDSRVAQLIEEAKGK
ncbi:MAG: hypothetical protein HY806_07540 [Nitrospirae bacterium]|nr:hypothetical protein [Nitrospirota bacterium]MBI4838973.1 hypothetical protein [Nitrospirota bacterium]